MKRAYSKFRTLLFIAIFVISYTVLIAQQRLNPREATLKILNEYSPDGYFILSEYEKLPDKYGRLTTTKTPFMRYIKGTSESHILQSINTAVHEISHSYTSLAPLKGEYDYYKGIGHEEAFQGSGYNTYPLAANETYTVRLTDVYRTHEMVGLFSKDLRTTRFNTYINTSSANLGSQVEGVYGLLDEMTAYYNGAKAVNDLYPFFQKTNTLDYWQIFLQDFEATFYGCLEFRLYIHKYMEYAAVKYPDIYQGILLNSNLWFVYQKLLQKSDSLYLKFKTQRQEVYKSIEKLGHKIAFSEDMRSFYKDENQGKRYVGTHQGEYNILEGELAKSEYAEREKLWFKNSEYDSQLFARIAIPPVVTTGFSGEFITVQSSSPEELPLQALTEPYVNLSAHTALIVQP